MIFVKFLCIVSLLAAINADVSELKIGETRIEHNKNHTEHNIHTLDKDIRALDDIKFSLQIILRELERLQSIPKFKTLQSQLLKGNDSLQEMVSTVESKLNQLTSMTETIPVQPPQVQLIPPKTLFSTVLDNYWLGEGYQTADASQRVVVAISPVLKAPRLRRDIPLFRFLHRRAINEPVAVKDYLPPLDANAIQQPYSKENGYEYKRPEIGLELTTTTEPTKDISATNIQNEYLPPNEDPLKPAETIKDDGYNYPRPQPAFPSASNIVTTTVQPATTTTKSEPTGSPSTLRPRQTIPPDVAVVTGYKYQTPSNRLEITTENSYLPPLEESNSNGGPVIEVPSEDDDGYNYPKPETSLEGSNTDQVDVNYPKQPFSPETGYEYDKPSINFGPDKDYLPPDSSQRSSNSIIELLNPLNRLAKDLNQLVDTTFVSI